MKRSTFDALMVGIAFGISVPVLCYLSLEGMLGMAIDWGWMEQLPASAVDRRLRSLYLFAICSNILLVQYFQKKKWDIALRGAIVATLIYAIVWIFYFQEVLFGN